MGFSTPRARVTTGGTASPSGDRLTDDFPGSTDELLAEIERLSAANRGAR